MSDLFGFLSGQFLGSISQITKQADVITSGVTSPLKGILGNVSGGVWKGDGADKFVAEMTNEVLPMLAKIFISHSNFASGLKKSHDRMQDAFKQSATIAHSLTDVFSSIF
jgi:hypothetical protein